jgi:hypothetical protein
MLLFFFGKIGCNGRLFVFLDKNNYFFKKTLFYFFVGYFILWKSPNPREPIPFLPIINAKIILRELHKKDDPIVK